MGKITRASVILPGEFDYQLTIHLANLRRQGIKITKSQEIIRLAQEGLSKYETNKSDSNG